MTDEHVDIVVVGAGVAGLVIAREAGAAGRRVVVLEQADRTGGLLRKGELDGIPIDLGAESFATRTTGVTDLIRDAALGLEVVSPADGGAHIVVVDHDASPHDGLLRAPLPRRTVLGIPADPMAADVVRILGDLAATRVAEEPRADVAAMPEREPSLAELVTAQCGETLTRRLVDPLCRSVYSVPAAQARLSRLHPAMWREFRARGRLVDAAAAIASPMRAGAAVAGIRGGMWQLVAALDGAAHAAGADIRTRLGATAIAHDGNGVVVATGAGRVRARRAVVATGATAARELLGVIDDASVPAPELKVVAALLEAPALDSHPVGSGVIVAPDVPSDAKALTHVDAKWPWMAQLLPPGRHIVRLSARDAGGPGLSTPAEVSAEIARLTGAPIAADDIVAIASARWSDAVASRPVDVAAEQALAADGIHLAGAAVAGTGLASVIPHARALSRTLIDATGPAVAPSADPTSRRNA